MAREQAESEATGVDHIIHLESASKKKMTSASTLFTMAPSRPVAIPVIGRKNRQHGTTGTARPKSHGRTSGAYATDVHRPDAIPPAIAALLAVTSIPQKRSKAPDVRGRGKGLGERRQRTHAIPVLDEKDMRGGGMSPLLDVLLSPSEDELDVSSISSESVPSLEDHDGSTAPLSSPITPGTDRTALPFRRKDKLLSSPPAEDCLFDHPLLPPQDGWSPPKNHQVHDFVVKDQIRALRPRSSLKSNLTTSLRVLRSAAKSFSHFTYNPYSQADHLLTGSALSISPQLTDDRRPLPLEDTPTPALRRYLNPFQNPQTEKMRSGSPPTSQESVCTASIQLQTYRVSTPPSRKSSTPLNETSSSLKQPAPTFTSNGSGPPVRQREPRENSAFLRIVVLEMNMRRGGKLSDTTPGRARLALPPRATWDRRRDGVGASSLEDEAASAVPRRWVGVSI